MESQKQRFNQSFFGQRLLKWVNLRPEESERTFFMFAFYAVTSIGLVWLEAITVALFLQQYGAEDGLPWIYIASAGIGSGLGFLYSQLQHRLPLRKVVVLAALLMALPLTLFWIGLGVDETTQIYGLALPAITIFCMRLWLEAVYALNDLNTSITANQLFNIREIKRTFPLISSGILVADVISGFSLKSMITLVGGLRNVMLLSLAFMMLGAIILFYLGQKYQQAFPDFLRRRSEERQPDFSNRRIQGPLQFYVTLLFIFFILAQVLLLLIDFRFLSDLQQGRKEEEMAAFLGLFNGILGIFELAMQWLVSSRLIERMGVFTAAILLPGVLSLFSAVCVGMLAVPGTALFIALVILKFFDELLHYTLFASVSPVLFQPLPEVIRGRIQAAVRGVAEPISTGVTGLALLSLVWLEQKEWATFKAMNLVLPGIFLLALAWMLTVWLMRSKYVGLLVMSAERGQLSTDVDLRELKQAVLMTLEQPSTEDHKASCIELLSQLDPRNVGEILAPKLTQLSPRLQQKSLEEMMEFPNPQYVADVQRLVDQNPTPEVLAVALRYIWITQETSDVRQLKPYLRAEVDPVVRGTAASLMLRRGNSLQKAEATNTLRLMLTHKQERERVMGCRALGEAVYMQSLRLHIPNLLQDESLRVRCALLEAIAATHLEEFYPSLLRGLYYKSTRAAAMKALVRLENEAVPMLVALAEDPYKPDLVRLHAWKVIGEIGTLEALNALISHLQVAWGADRRNLLKILLEIPNDVGIESTLDEIGRSGVERLIDQEIMLVGQIYAALVDLAAMTEREAELLKRALSDMVSDAQERLFLLMKFLYPLSAINAAAFSLHSTSASSAAHGLEILDNTLDIPSKRALLSILDRGSEREKLSRLAEVYSYQPLSASDRLRHLIDLRHFLSDWALACCFHLARSARWSVTAEQILACLRHPCGFIREAVVIYLNIASPRALQQLLPNLQKDPDPIVASIVREVRRNFSEESNQQQNPLTDGNSQGGFSQFPGLKPST